MYEIAMMFWGSVAGIGVVSGVVAYAIDALRAARPPRERGVAQAEALAPVSSRRMAEAM